MTLKHFLKNLPVAGPIGVRLKHFVASANPKAGTTSGMFWEDRYREGGTSGSGSYDRLAAFKAEVLNDLIDRHDVRSVTEWGCGDGNQLTLAAYPEYIGYDVSPSAVDICRERFEHDDSKVFHLVDEYDDERTDAAFSLDVIFHLVEDEAFEAYMERLFKSASRLVVIYSSDTDENAPNSPWHVRHRRFSRWIAEKEPDWRRIETIPNRYPLVDGDPDTSFADFHVFRKN